jgi:hypothetical protein
MKAPIDSPLLQVENGKVLYCVAWQYVAADGTVTRGFEYLHALSSGEAKRKYLRSLPLWKAYDTEVIASAPVIGYHVKDKHGEKLTV